MAGRREVRCVGPSHQLADRKKGCQRSINCYMAQVEGLGDDRSAVLESVPGLLQAIGLNGSRGSYATGSRMFIVAGNELLEWDATNTILRGYLNTTTGDVQMKHGQTQLVVVDGAYGYVFDLLSSVFTIITAEGWQGSSNVEELSGYFIFAPGGDSDQFYISQPDNALEIDALDFSAADARPDRLIAQRVLRNELKLMGERSIETWVLSGDLDFPLQRYNAAAVDVGVVGPRAAVVSGDSMVWIGSTDRGNGIVYVMRGSQPERISDEAVEEALRTSTDLSAAYMWTYQTKAAEFVGMTAPGMETTWVLNLATKQWHEMAEAVEGEWVPSRIIDVTWCHGQHWALGPNALYRIGPEYRDFAGDPKIRERTWPHLQTPSLEPMNHRSVEVACTTGYGGNLSLLVSNDGGSVFGPPLTKSLGATGRRMERLRWHFLGSSHDRVYRLRCSDAVPLTIHSATVDAS